MIHARQKKGHSSSGAKVGAEVSPSKSDWESYPLAQKLAKDAKSTAGMQRAQGRRLLKPRNDSGFGRHEYCPLRFAPRRLISSQLIRLAAPWLSGESADVFRHVGDELRERDAQKCLDNQRIELAACRSGDFLAGGFEGTHSLRRSLGSHGFERVGDGQDPCPGRNLIKIFNGRPFCNCSYFC